MTDYSSTTPPDIVPDFKEEQDEMHECGDSSEFMSTPCEDKMLNGKLSESELESKKGKEEESELISVRAKLAERNVPTALLDLMFWQNVKLSGAVFIIGSAVLLLLDRLSFISVFAYINMSIVATVWALKMYTSIQSTLNSQPSAHPFQQWLKAEITVSPERATKYIERFSPHIENCLNKFRAVIMFENTLTTLKVIFLMYALTYVGAWMNLLTLVFMSFVAFFTAPIIYEKKQREINHMWVLTVTKTNKAIHDAWVKMEPHLTSSFEKLPPVVKNPLSKFLKLESAKTS